MCPVFVYQCRWVKKQLGGLKKNYRGGKHNKNFAILTPQFNPPNKIREQFRKMSPFKNEKLNAKTKKSPWNKDFSLYQPVGHYMAPRAGLEPATTRLTAACSANWANEEYTLRIRIASDS